MSYETTELQGILDEFERECFMLRVEASETRARDDVVRESYERIRDEFAGRIAAVVGNGTLTAEQVEKAIRDCSTYASYDGCTYYASGIRLQAIADELNAELGSGTCHITASATDGLCSHKPRKHFELSCGHGFTLDGLEAPAACAVCGRKVER